MTAAQDESRGCERCGDVVATLSSDNLCDGCVAEDSVSLQARIADVLNGEWPNCFCDGFQDAVAQVAAETVMDAPLNLRAPEIGRLLDSIRTEIEEPDGSWNGGDVVDLLCQWFTALGYAIGGPRP